MLFPEIHRRPPVVCEGRLLEYLQELGYENAPVNRSLETIDLTNHSPMRYHDHETVSYFEGHLAPVALCYAEHYIRNEGTIPLFRDLELAFSHDSLEDVIKGNPAFGRERMTQHIKEYHDDEFFRDVLLMSTDIGNEINDYEKLQRFEGNPRLANMKYCDRLIGFRAKPITQQRVETYLEMSERLHICPTLVQELQQELNIH